MCQRLTKLSLFTGQVLPISKGSQKNITNSPELRCRLGYKKNNHGSCMHATTRQSKHTCSSRLNMTHIVVKKAVDKMVKMSVLNDRSHALPARLLAPLHFMCFTIFQGSKLKSPAASLTIFSRNYNPSNEPRNKSNQKESDFSG